MLAFGHVGAVKSGGIAAMTPLLVTLLCRYINNQREEYKFVFNGILPSDCTQEEVFTRVCKPAVDVSLDGINSTIFAYGQTGSGKTFTITGGPEKYSGRFIKSGFSLDDCTQPACLLRMAMSYQANMVTRVRIMWCRPWPHPTGNITYVQAHLVPR
jgi:Kinesin motor domain